MFRHATPLAILMAALAAQDPAPREETPPKRARYVVVVSKANPIHLPAAELRATVKKLYLKTLTQWPGGVPARPYARDATSPAQLAFEREVLGMTDAELARHWLRLKNMQGTTPPRRVSSDRLALKHITRADGAFTILAADEAEKAEDVRILFDF
ncbi:MAG: hypothetical protein KDE27_10060 [Planctomycetes bacterium]|nr:hypothetical protein [Planctomycetota bacterium]